MPERRRVVIAILVALALSGLALVIVPRTLPTLDTVNYVSMAEGKYNLAMAPYRYRVAVPFLAHLLPLAPLDALRLITCVSLLLVYLASFAECSILNIQWMATVISVVAMFCSRPNLFNYFNPFLTDGMGLLVLFLLALSFLADRLGIFAALIIVGVFVRESALFALPPWLLTPRWKRAAGMGLLVLVLYLTPRILLPSDLGYRVYVVDGLRSKLHSPGWLGSFGKALILSWQGMWLLAGYGVLQLPRRFKLLGAALALGSFASFLVAADYSHYSMTRTIDRGVAEERLLGVLAPIIVPSAAVTIELAARASRSVVGLFIATFPLQFLFGNPYVLQSLTLQHYRMLLALTVVLTTAISVLLLATAISWRSTRDEHEAIRATLG